MPAVVDTEKCTGCESCIDECQSDAISMVDGKASVEADSCIDCGACIDGCPVEALSL
ncbi:MAG: 4Fe-4S binding protein [Phycisphaerales bacterium]|nr:MAG: 4Fe-4S binding protein [Phycisphaerales bacterium]